MNDNDKLNAFAPARPPLGMALWVRFLYCACSCITLWVGTAAKATAEDSALTRQMAAEIVEQAASSNAAYATVLRDVSKALRSKQMSVSDAKDLLTLAAACQQLGVQPVHGSPSAGVLTPISPISSIAPVAAFATENKAPPALISPRQKAKQAAEHPGPTQLDIDALLDEGQGQDQAASARESLFKGLDPQTTDDGTAGSAYQSGTAGRQLPWGNGSAAAVTPAASTEHERQPLSGEGTESVDMHTLKRASKRTSGTITMLKPGADGLPQLALVSIGSGAGLKENQEVIISRDGQPLVKAVVNRLKETDAFVFILPKTWAASVKHELKIGDSVAGL